MNLSAKKSDPYKWHEPWIVEHIDRLQYPKLALADYPYAPSAFGAEVLVKLPWPQRLLLLVGCRLVVKQTLQCEHRVENLRTSSAVFLMPPMWMVRIANEWRK